MTYCAAESSSSCSITDTWQLHSPTAFLQSKQRGILYPREKQLIVTKTFSQSPNNGAVYYTPPPPFPITPTPPSPGHVHSSVSIPRSRPVNVEFIVKVVSGAEEVNIAAGFGASQNFLGMSWNDYVPGKNVNKWEIQG